MKWILATLVVVLSSVSAAQQFAIGDSREMVRRSFGSAPGFYSVPYDRYFPPGQEAFVLAAGSYADVWDVSAPSNTFRARMFFIADSRASRLHPVERLQSVRLISDKRQPGSALLAQVDPFAALCRKDGCFVQASRSHDGTFPELHVCAKAGVVDVDIAAGAYEGWGTSHAPGIFSICAELIYGEHAELKNFALKNVPFKYLEVDTISISGESLTMLNRAREVMYIGDWHPGGDLR